MEDANDRLTGVGAHLRQRVSSPSPVEPKRRKGLPIAALKLAPVTNWRGLGDAGPGLKAGLMQPEGELDDIGNGVVVGPGPAPYLKVRRCPRRRENAP